MVLNIEIMKEEFFKKGILEIINLESLKTKLESGKTLRVKFGADPTRPDIHLGHAVTLRKLKELQEAGHKIVFIIGDYTTKIGDPSGRNSTRPVLSDEEIKENAKTYFDQVGKILDLSKTEIRYNSEWFRKLTFAETLALAAKFSVAQIIERDDFENRLKAGLDLGLHELLYPVMQAYDSVMIRADIEFGGSDQRFNMLAGRDLQRKSDQAPQDVVITKLLVGLDGKEKMSKSLDNYIAVNDSPTDMFGKVMSIPDSAISDYLELASDFSEEEIMELKNKLEGGANPRDIKLELARNITSIYHGEEKASDAKEEFLRVFSRKELPTELISVNLSKEEYLPVDLLLELSVTSSRSEARRLVEQGGLRVGEEKVTNLSQKISISKGTIIKAGKRKVYKVSW